MDVALRPPDVAAPADDFGVGRRPLGAARGEQDDGFEERGLAGRVRAPDELRTCPEGRVEAGVAADVAEAQ
jgi:hypothetical protein